MLLMAFCVTQFSRWPIDEPLLFDGRQEMFTKLKNLHNIRKLDSMKLNMKN